MFVVLPSALYIWIMYTRQQASHLRQSFWTTFGQYISPVLSAEGLKKNWVNYKTGETHLTFKMDATDKSATIAIILAHPDLDIQQLYFEQFRQLTKILYETLEEEWTWEQQIIDDNGKTISRIYKQLNNVSIFNKEDWSQLISFFKERIIALDNFWNITKPAFESLH
jgi:hypothetical protein